MLIVLPPSETKSTGGTGAPLNFEALSFPSLNEIRAGIAADLIELCLGEESEAMAALKLGPKLAEEIHANATLMSSPTAPAIERYTGVLYDALDAPSLSSSARSQLAVGSALFGVVSAEDMIPHYRLSAGSKLPARTGDDVPTMRKRWGKSITQALQERRDEEKLLVDLRSGAYANLGKVPGSISMTVLTEEGKVVSHFNKHYKGVFARIVTSAERSAESIVEVIDIARAGGLDIELDADGNLVYTVRT